MTLDPELTTALTAVADLLGQARDPWWIIAGAAVALHGVDAGPVADVDVLLSPDDAARILSTLGIPLRAGSAHPDFRSDIFGTWRGTALPVELMADFRHRSGGTWRAVRPETRQPVGLGNAVLFVPDAAELARLLLAFGRPKDVARARRLQKLG